MAAQPPQVAYANPEANVSIAISVHDLPGAGSMTLEEGVAPLRRSLEAIAPEWRRAGVVSIDGRDWMALELKVAALDTEIENLFVVTLLEDHIVLINANATVAQFPKCRRRCAPRWPACGSMMGASPAARPARDGSGRSSGR